VEGGEWMTIKSKYGYEIKITRNQLFPPAHDVLVYDPMSNLQVRSTVQNEDHIQRIVEKSEETIHKAAKKYRSPLWKAVNSPGDD